jgi:maltose alpha-D-glucosyltransferase / alpha-amylase
VLVIRYDWRNNSALFAHNLSHLPKEIVFDLGKVEGSDALINLLSEAHSRADDDGRHTMLIEGYGYHWYRVGGLDYLLRRS